MSDARLGRELTGNEAYDKAHAEVERHMVLQLVKSVKNATNGESIHEIELEEPTVAMWVEAMKKTGVEAEVDLIAYATKTSPGTVKQMALSDFVKSRDFLLNFARSSLPDGQA